MTSVGAHGDSGRPIRIVTFTTLYPNAVDPAHGIFVENRLRHLLATGDVASRVVAPVPWFPSALSPFSRTYARYARVPGHERRNEIDILHPRYPVLPKIGMALGPASLFLRSLPVLRRLQAEGGDFDLIDAHYFYPDGVAAAMLGRVLRKPVVITARGSDVTLIARFALERAMIRSAANRAAGIITVSKALKDELIRRGVRSKNIRVLRNGVDLTMFRPLDRAQARRDLGFEGPTLLSVGLLIERKGHDLIIEAMARLPGYRLAIAGEGPERAALEALTRRTGVADRVRFLGLIRHDRLASVFSAADALVLASSREGWPNVLLEAMACGTPVVVSNVAGMSEVVTDRVGVMMPERTPAGVGAAVEQLFSASWDRSDIRRYAEDFSWEETSKGQISLFREILGAVNTENCSNQLTSARTSST